MNDTLIAALHRIPSDDRETWVTVGMALRSHMGDAGFDLWDRWSRQSESYRARDARAVWRSFKGGAVTIGSLYHLAKEHGWDGNAPVRPQVDPQERQRRQQQARSEEQRRQQDAARAARRATQMLGEAAMATHPYLARKGFPDTQGLVIGHDGLLLVPMRHYRTGAVQSVQTIAADGQKKFLAGGRAKGAVFSLGRSSFRWYVEGYATALSVQAALKYLYRRDQVVVCFSAGNIPNVAGRQGCVVVDHDESGTGEKYARKTGLPFWIPPELGDANDFHLAYGVDSLADELREVINATPRRRM